MPTVPCWEVLCTGRAWGTNRYVLDGRRGRRQQVGLTAGSQARLQEESARTWMTCGPGATAAWAWARRTQEVQEVHCLPTTPNIRNSVPILESQEVWGWALVSSFRKLSRWL